MPPSTPKRTQIRAALLAALRTIAAGEVYHTNLGTHVFSWRPLKKKPFEQKEIPGCNVRDIDCGPIQELTGGNTNVWYNRLTVEIDIACFDIDTFTKVVADIYTAIDADCTLGGLAIDINSTGYVPDVDQEERTVIGGTVTLIVDYQTNRLAV